MLVVRSYINGLSAGLGICPDLGARSGQVCPATGEGCQAQVHQERLRVVAETPKNFKEILQRKLTNLTCLIIVLKKDFLEHLINFHFVHSRN